MARSAAPAHRSAPILGLALALAAWPLWAAAAGEEADKARAEAAQRPPPAELAGAAGSAEAPLVVLRRQVAVFRAPFLGVSAQDRARRTREVLEQRLERPGPGKVTVQSSALGNILLVDGEMALILTERDADPLTGQTLDEATRAAAAQLARVIEETAEGRDRDRILRDALAALLATAIFAALVALVLWGRRKLAPRLAHLVGRVAHAFKVGGAEVIADEVVLTVVQKVLAGVAWLVIAIAAYRWLSAILLQFPYTRPWGEQLSGFFTGVASTILGGVLHALPDLIVAAVVLLLARGVIGLAAPLFDRAEAGRVLVPWLDRDSSRPTRRLFNLGVWLFALVMAYPYLPGSQSEAFKGMSVLIGLMITIGGSSVFGQAASGLILMYSGTLRAGDYVRIQGEEGTVTELGTFTTKLRTGLGEEVTLPNSLVLGAVSKNYSRALGGDGYVVHTSVTIGYDTPWRQVEAMLVEAARRTEGVLEDPPPRVFQTELTDFYPHYRLVCRASPRDPRPRAEVMARLHANIQDVFNEHGVQIMSPHYLGDPSAKKVVPPEGWYAAPARPPGAAAGGSDPRRR